MWTEHRSSGHAEVASHIAQPEALTTRICNYVLGGFGEKKKKNQKKKEDWQQLLAQVPIFKKRKKEYSSEEITQYLAQIKKERYQIKKLY